MNSEPAFTVVAPDRELTIEYGGRTFNLTAYATDLGVWECAVHEVSTGGPAVPASQWGVSGPFRSPFTALAELTEAVIREVEEDANSR